MKIGPLKLFSATNSKRTFNVASWHSRHSLTWSWILSLAFDGIWTFSPVYSQRRGLRIGFHPYRTNHGVQWVLTLPGLCLQWHRQREMWFRDMYRRAADERDDAEQRVRKQGRLMAFLAAKDREP